MDDRYVIAMDWIEGADLEALLDREGRPGLEPAVAIGYLEQAAEALEHLHAHDPLVVHGDVKPANLILTVRVDHGRTAGLLGRSALDPLVILGYALSTSVHFGHVAVPRNRTRLPGSVRTGHPDRRTVLDRLDTSRLVAQNDNTLTL